MKHLVLLVAAALIAGACSPGPGTTASPGADGASPTTIRFLLSGGPEELAAYTAIADEFALVRPELEVEVSAVARQDDLLARLTSGFAASSPPDVFLINFRKYGLYAAEEVLAPVQPFIDASELINPDEFFQAPLAAFQFYGENQTCLPQNVSSLVTYVNRELFEAAGVALPTGDWDWDQFSATAKALTDEVTGVHGIGTDPALIRLAPMVWSAGGAVVDNQLAPTTLTLDTPEALEALDFFTSLVATGVAPDDLDEQARDSEARFIDGNLAMFWSSRKEVPGFREAIDDFTWDVVPFPLAPDGERVTMLHADAFCLAAGTGREQSAWDFVEFALGPLGATILAESGRTVPSNKAVANSPAFLRTDAPPANGQVFLDNAEIVRATPSTATWNEVENQADDILKELFYGRITKERALARLGQLVFR
ncbi:MAG: multiple sugar transport system substrate-binding protein [Glaciecola sp.]